MNIIYNKSQCYQFRVRTRYDEKGNLKDAVIAGLIRCVKDLARGSVRERMELLPLTSIVVR